MFSSSLFSDNLRPAIDHVYENFLSKPYKEGDYFTHKDYAPPAHDYNVLIVKDSQGKEINIPRPNHGSILKKYSIN